MEKIINLMSQNCFAHPGGCLCEDGYFDPNIFYSKLAFITTLIIILSIPLFINLLWNKGKKFDHYYDEYEYRNKRDFIFTMTILTPIFIVASWFLAYIVIFGVISLWIFQIINYFYRNKHIDLYNKLKPVKKTKSSNPIDKYKQKLLEDIS
jgi:hypothetical protein